MTLGALCVIAPLAVATIPFALTVPSSSAFEFLTLQFQHFKLTVPVRTFSLLFSITFCSLSSALMFPEIIKSRRLSRDLIYYKFNTKKYGTELPLINILLNSNNGRKEWSDSQIKYAIYKAQKMISVKKENKSPLLVLSVRTFEKQLSADISNAIIDRLGKILNKFKLSQVEEKKSFISNRMVEVKLDLVRAEENLKVFRERNRKIIASPTLLLEQERMIREVRVHTEVYITLKSQFEMAQIEQVERQNMLQILDPPEAPTLKESPQVNRNTIIAALLGLSFAMGFIYLKTWYENNMHRIRFNNIGGQYFGNE